MGTNLLESTMPMVSLIIPIYNYASRVHRTVSTIHQFCVDNGKDWEIIFVDDGSTDQTVAAVKALIQPYPYMRIIKQPSNLGKGAAVRRGLQESTGDYHIFTDVDLAYDLDQVEKVLEELQRGSDLAFADRRHPESTCVVDENKLDYQKKRDTMSYVLNKLVERMGLGNIRDTQAGLKGIRKSASPILAGGTVNGFPFDIELFAIARVNKLKTTAVPIKYYIEDAPSTVMPVPVAFEFLKSIRTIRKKMIQGSYYAVQPS